MGIVIPLGSRRPAPQSRARVVTPPSARQTPDPQVELPLLLSRLLAAGAAEFTRIALDAWARKELDPAELVELCNTYADVMGLKNLWDASFPEN